MWSPFDRHSLNSACLCDLLNSHRENDIFTWNIPLHSRFMFKYSVTDSSQRNYTTRPLRKHGVIKVCSREYSTTETESGRIPLGYPRPAGDQLSTGAQWNAFRRLVGHSPATKKRRDRKLGCVVGASDMIMFINGYHRNQPIDRRMHP